jgi:DNA methylase
MRMLDTQGRLVYPPKPTGRLAVKNHLDEMSGSPLSDVWIDVKSLSGSHAERLGYPTQKPLALLERIITLSSNEGDVVLDPFCGCGKRTRGMRRQPCQWFSLRVAGVHLVSLTSADVAVKPADDTPKNLPT